MNTFVVLVENIPGVLTRVSSLVRRRAPSSSVSMTMVMRETPWFSV